jgi:hypothetical protein
MSREERERGNHKGKRWKKGKEKRRKNEGKMIF